MKYTIIRVLIVISHDSVRGICLRMRDIVFKNSNNYSCKPYSNI